MTVPDYYAPATELICLHLKNPHAPAVHDASARLDNQNSTIGETRCGRPMLLREYWQITEYVEGDRVCPACQGKPEGEQEALL